MIPMFICVMELMSGEQRLINFQYVQQITRMKEKEGSVLYFNEGKKLLVKETPKQLIRELTEIRYYSG